MDKEIDTMLVDAARKGYLDVLLRYVKNGANINVKDVNEWGLLHLLIFRIHEDINKSKFSEFNQLIYQEYLDTIKALIDLGIDVNAASFSKETPLHFAAEYGHLEIAYMLIKHGANVNAVNYRGVTPLHKAIISKNFTGDYEIVRILVENGADVNAQDNDGRSPLLYSVALLGSNPGASRDISIFLVKNGANLYAVGNDGWSPFKYISRKEWAEEIMAAYSEYQSRVALRKVEETDGNNLKSQVTRKPKVI